MAKRAVPVLNPIITLRERGKETLTLELNKLELVELITIARNHTPDLSGATYRSKNKEKVIEYIMGRAYDLVRLGRCFRY